MYTRPTWDEYFLKIAWAVSSRADCRRRQFGAVIVKNNRIVSTGYNGSPSGGPSCLAGECPRGLQTHETLPGYQHGNHDYSDCVALHDTQNAIAYASHSDCVDATIYLWPSGPCDMCLKLIRAAGIIRVVHPEAILDLT